MKTFLTIALVGLISGVGFADVSKEDVKKLLAAGLSDEVVLNYVRQHAPMAKLTPDDVADLKASGATDSLLKALLDAGSAQAPAAAPSSTYTSPDSTTVYTYPSYEYDYYYYPYSYYYTYPYYPYYGPYFSFGFFPRHHFFGDHRFDHRFDNRFDHRFDNRFVPRGNLSGHGFSTFRGGAGVRSGGGHHR